MLDLYSSILKTWQPSQASSLATATSSSVSISAAEDAHRELICEDLWDTVAFIVCNAIICSLAVWNFSLDGSSGHNGEFPTIMLFIALFTSLSVQLDAYLIFLGALGVVLIIPTCVTYLSICLTSSDYDTTVLPLISSETMLWSTGCGSNVCGLEFSG